MLLQWSGIDAPPSPLCPSHTHLVIVGHGKMETVHCTNELHAVGLQSLAKHASRHAVTHTKVTLWMHTKIPSARQVLIVCGL